MVTIDLLAMDDDGHVLVNVKDGDFPQVTFYRDADTGKVRVASWCEPGSFSAERRDAYFTLVDAYVELNLAD